MTLRSRLLWLTVFGVAFGWMEASVVVYLREIYYPDGFAFPTVLPTDRILLTELVRELATLAMLLGAAMVAGRTGWERFGVFSFLFGVWDLVYYAALWIVLRWPESLLTWDVLFLIPLIWAGPVLSAALIAASLTAAGLVIIRRTEAGFRPRVSRWDWAGAGVSLALLLYSFMANHRVVRGYEVPESFPWVPYALGTVLGWGIFARTFLGRGHGGSRDAP